MTKTLHCQCVAGACNTTAYFLGTISMWLQWHIDRVLDRVTSSHSAVHEIQPYIEHGCTQRIKCCTGFHCWAANMDAWIVSAEFSLFNPQTLVIHALRANLSPCAYNAGAAPSHRLNWISIPIPKADVARAPLPSYGAAVKVLQELSRPLFCVTPSSTESAGSIGCSKWLIYPRPTVPPRWILPQHMQDHNSWRR